MTRVPSTKRMPRSAPANPPQRFWTQLSPDHFGRVARSGFSFLAWYLGIGLLLALIGVRDPFVLHLFVPIPGAIGAVILYGRGPDGWYLLKAWDLFTALLILWFVGAALLSRVITAIA